MDGLEIQRRVRAAGGYAERLQDCKWATWVLALPRGAAFLLVMQRGQQPDAHQAERLARLGDWGIDAAWVTDLEGLDEFLARLTDFEDPAEAFR